MSNPSDEMPADVNDFGAEIDTDNDVVAAFDAAGFDAAALDVAGNEVADSDAIVNNAVETDAVELDVIAIEEIDSEEVTSDPNDVRRQETAAIEAVLMVASDPVPSQLLAELLEVSIDHVEVRCEEMAASYDREERGFVLVKVAGGYRFQSHPAYRGYVERFILDDVPHRLSPAALETLAIVAYKQPISRVQIATIRGVNVDGVMRALTQRGYVEQIGRDDGPGQAVLFGTTPEFLERLGLDSIADLPPLAAFVPDVQIVEALEHVLRAEPTE